MASVTLRPATTADAPSIASVHYRALERFHEFYGSFFALNPREILARSTAAALGKRENEFVVAVDGATGEVVGFVRYVVEEAEKQEEAAAAAAAGPSLFAAKQHLEGLWEEFNKRQGEIDACYDKALKGRRHIYVNHLMIDPDHQRKGIGGKLLGAALERSDREGIPAYLVSSAESHGLYSKMGFESLGRWTIDNGDWAGRIAEVERGLGIAGNDGLEERFRGVMEVEDAMMRMPRE